MAMKTREALLGFHTGIDTKRLFPTSRLLSSITGMTIPRNKAVVGENAFAHESGIHQHGMLKHHSTYEIMRPEDVGLTRSHLVLGKHSGRAALRDRIKELGFELSDAELARVFEDFKSLADKKKELFDGDIEALVLKAEFGASGPWHLEGLHAVSDSARRRNGACRAAAHRWPAAVAGVDRRRPGGCRVQGDRDGDRRGGHAAQVRGPQRLDGRGRPGRGRGHRRAQRRSYRGTSVTTDIVESGVRAFLEVVNRIESTRATAARTEKRNPEAEESASTI